MIRPRRVLFDWSATPLYWIPDDPYATHFLNVLHLLLPAGERWFVTVYKKAVPLITDERLLADVKGFIAQEALHARAHEIVLDWLQSQGIDTTAFVERIEWYFRKLLGDRDGPDWFQRWWLVERLGGIAAIEHYTYVIGRFALERSEFERAGTDPVMLDLLRWHGAEEVEHRSVAFDVFRHLHGGYGRRAWSMALMIPTFVALWAAGFRYLVSHDPGLQRAARWRDYRDVVRRGLAPGAAELVAALPAYLRPGFHPSGERGTEMALEYLATSPSVRIAAARRPSLGDDART